MDKIMELPLLPLRGVIVFPYDLVNLDVGRERSINALENAMEHNNLIFLLAQREAGTEEPGIEDLYPVGTIAEIKQVLKLLGGTNRILVEGISRARVREVSAGESFISVEVEAPEEYSARCAETEAIMRSLYLQFEEYAKQAKRISAEDLSNISDLESPGQFADVIASHIPLKLEQK